MIKLFFFFIALQWQQYAHAHIALTFPPPRYYGFDYVSNLLFYGKEPCGDPPQPDAPKTTLLAGSNITVSWHLSYPHQGGVKIQLIRERPEKRFREEDDVITNLTQGFTSMDDMTRQEMVVTLPNTTCENCTIRVVRQGLEYFSTYEFWSCADVTLLEMNLPEHVRQLQSLLQFFSPESSRYTDLKNRFIKNNYALPGTGCYEGECLNGGTCNSSFGDCHCHRLFTGDRCQYKDECWTDEDCSYHGQCIDSRSAVYPKLKCYCMKGWYGSACEKKSEITEILDDYSSNSRYMSEVLYKDNAYIYWTYVKNYREIEIVLRYKTFSWVGIGWKPTTTPSSCKRMLEKVSVVKQKQDMEQDMLFQRQANYTTTEPSPHRDPEIDIENRLGDTPKSCRARPNGKKRKRKSVSRLRRQAYQSAMPCADITIGSVKGNLYRVEDMWTRDCSMPMPDTHFGGTDDITSAFGKQENGFTTIAFRKKTAANHFTDHSPSATRRQIVLWAKGQNVNNYYHSPRSALETCRISDNRFYKHDDLKYHGNGKRDQNGRKLFAFTRPSFIPTTIQETTTTTAGTTTSSCITSGRFKSPTSCTSTTTGFNCVYSIEWQLSGQNIRFTLKGRRQPNQYMSIGISNNRRMPMTDVYAVQLGNDNSVTVTDRWASGYAEPSIDSSQDVTLVTHSYNNGILTAVFERPLATPSSNTITDLTVIGCWHLLFCRGGMIGQNRLFRHSFRTVVSLVCLQLCKK